MSDKPFCEMTNEELVTEAILAEYEFGRYGLYDKSPSRDAALQRKEGVIFEAKRRDAELSSARSTEPVPPGTYLTKHADGFISYGNGQLSVSERKSKMKIWVGTLPDGWELRRPVSKAKRESK